MICEVCGRDNAEHLRFCQDCGARLERQRVVPPTPPNGMPKVDLGQPAQPKSRSLRPEAPVFSFAPAAEPTRSPEPPRAVEPPRAEPPAPPSHSKPVALAGNICSVCAADNPPEYRFCVTCGAALKGKSEARMHAVVGTNNVAKNEPPPSSEPPTRAQPSRNEAAAPVAISPFPVAKAPSPKIVDDGKIVPAPVVGIVSGDAPVAKSLVCSRCQGICSAGTRFCKFCGAPLDEHGSQPGRAPRQPAMTTPATPAAKGSGVFESPRATLASAQQSPAEPVKRAPPPAPPPPPQHREGPAPTVRQPQSASKSRLVVIVEDGTEGRSFSLESGQVDIGRSEGDILLDDDHYVSPRHARLVLEGGSWHVRDLESTNKVYVRIKKPHPLLDGDLLLLGLEVLQFQTVSDAEHGLGHATQHGTLLFGSPAATRRARLCQRTVEGITRDVYHLFRDETVIGRETGDIVFTADPFLSRRHAAVRRNPVTGEYFVLDLDSSNGTFLAIRGEIALNKGDFIRIGQHLFRLDTNRR